MRPTPKRQRPRQTDLREVASKMTLKLFDGSEKVIAHAWLHKMDTYLALHPMFEVFSIRFGMLHLDKIAHDWLYHGLVAL